LIKTKIQAVINLKLPIAKSDYQAKLELRKLRFQTGLTNQLSTQSAQELNENEKKKMKERAKKFGLPVAEEEEQKLKVRAERFKIPVKLTETEEKQKMMERALRFGTMTEEMEEDRKKMRIERFGRVLPEAGDHIRKKFKKN